MRYRKWLVGAGTALLALTQVPGGAAEAPVAQGWWWVANTSLAPQTIPPPPTVPEDGLYVASNALGDEAVAALLFVLPEGTAATTLTLRVSGVIAGVASMQLCPTIGNWAAVQAGVWESRPKYECAGSGPTATVSEDGTTVSFDLRGQPPSRTVDVAVVPAADDSGQVPNFRASFEKPGPDSLATTAPGGAGLPSGSPVAGDAGLPAPEQAAPVTFSEVGGVSALPLADDSLTGAAGPLAAPVEGQTGSIGRAPAFGVASPVVSGVPRTEPRNDLRTIGMFGLIVLAAVYSRLSGKERRPPRSLVDFGRNR
jgi:hypothetical protein